MKKNYFILFITILGVFNLNAQIVITEIMYNGPESGTDTTEYVELYNIGSSDVNMSGYRFTQGFIYTFGTTTIKAGEYLVITVSSTDLNNVFGAGTADLEWGSGALSNSGEDIQLDDDMANVVDYVNYDDQTPWPSGTDGQGSSLRLCDPTLDNTDPANWSASVEGTGVFVNGNEYKGTPGENSDCSGLSINDLFFEKLKITPNPSANFITISGLKTKVDFEIYNTLGTQIFKGTITDNGKIDIRTFSNGLYFL